MQHAQSFFEYSKSHRTLCEFYKIRELGSIGNFSKVEIMACGALLEYGRVTQRGSIPRIEFPKTYKQQNFMLIDASARRNLELFATQFGEKKGSLISVIDHTVTASGGRFACSKAINLRLSTAQFFVNNREPRRKIREILSNIPDIERSLSRLILGRGSPKDVNLLKIGLEKTLELSEFLSTLHNYCLSEKPAINSQISFQYLTREKEPVFTTQVISSDESELNTIHKSLGNHKDLFELLNSAILDNNLSSVKEGRFIKPKYNSELSELSYILNNSNKLVTKLRESYRDLTGIVLLMN